MSSNGNRKDIFDLVKEIIDTSPPELTQLRIDHAMRVYYGVVDDIIKHSHPALTQLRIDNLDMKDEYFTIA